jgi:hypothetical protein
LELLVLSNPSRRSSSAIRAFKAAFSAVSAAFSDASARKRASSSARFGWTGGSQLIRVLNPNPIPLSSAF